MKKTLLIVTKLQDDLAASLAEQVQTGTVVLTQDAVFGNRAWGLPVFAAKEDVEARGHLHTHELVDADGLLDLIESHEKVVVL